MKEKRKKILLILTIAVLFFSFSFLLSSQSLAADGKILTNIKNNMGSTNLKELGGEKLNLPYLVGDIIGKILAFLGIVFILLIIWAGFQWMTAGGDTGKVGKSKTLILNAVIGLIIIMMSYGITTFVIKSINDAMKAPGASTPTAPLPTAADGTI